MSDQFRPPRRAYDPDAPADAWRDDTAIQPRAFDVPGSRSPFAPPLSSPPASSPPASTYPSAGTPITAEPDYGYSRVIQPTPAPAAPSVPSHSARPVHPRPTPAPSTQPPTAHSARVSAAHSARPATARSARPNPGTPTPATSQITTGRGIHPEDAPARGYVEPLGAHAGYPGQVYGPPEHHVRTRTQRGWPVVLAVILAMLVAGFYGYQRQTGAQSAVPQNTPAPPPSRPATVDPSPASSPKPNTVSKPAGEVGALAKGLVLINTTVPGGGRAAGTGMILTPDGRVLTNYHVVRGSDEITIIVAATGQKFIADLVGHDYSQDVAVLQLRDARDLDVVTLDKDAVRVNDKVTAVGNTQGQGTLTATQGTVKALNQTVTIEGDESGDVSAKIDGMIVSTVAAEPGDSGGPTYDAQGEVIGVTSAGASTNDQSEPSGSTDGSEPITFTIPIATAMAVVNQVLSGKQTSTVRIGPNGFLGVSVGKVKDGLGVVTVTKDSPADKAGLVSGDVITSVNGTTMKHPSDLTKVMQSSDPGDQLNITWIAGDGSGIRTETVTAAESPWN